MSANELRAWREKLGITQSVAAGRVGYSARQYQRFEAGECPIPRPLGIILAKRKLLG